MPPDTPSDDERESIIEAAYSCLSEPHRGAVPVAAILARAQVSTRAFYRHFESKDELFLALLRQECEAMADRLDRIADEELGRPIDQLEAWIRQMFGLANDPRLRMHMRVIDSDEVRAARGYRETRERAHTDRERSLVEILKRGRKDGSFPLAEPESDAIAISAVVSRALTLTEVDKPDQPDQSVAWVLDFALRAELANPPVAEEAPAPEAPAADTSASEAPAPEAPTAE